MITVGKLRKMMESLPPGMEVRFEPLNDVESQTEQKIVAHGTLIDEDDREFFSIELENT